MSDHVRRQLRDAVRSLIATAEPAFTVKKSGSRRIASAELPVVRVFTRREQAETEAVSGYGIERRIEVRCVVNVLGGDDTDDVLDAHSVTIENTVLGGAAALNSIVQDITYVGSELSDEASGEEQQGMLEVIFSALVYTPEGDPTVIET